MALSDWESTGEHEWHKFSKNGKRLSGNKFYDGVVIVETVNGDWTFNSYYRAVPKEYQYKLGRLKNEAQAIKLAQKYMRTH